MKKYFWAKMKAPQEDIAIVQALERLARNTDDWDLVDYDSRSVKHKPTGLILKRDTRPLWHVTIQFSANHEYYIDVRRSSNSRVARARRSRRYLANKVADIIDYVIKYKKEQIAAQAYDPPKILADLNKAIAEGMNKYEYDKVGSDYVTNAKINSIIQYVTDTACSNTVYKTVFNTQ